MKELSLNILDISENSVKAGATLIQIDLKETNELFTIAITDNGCGMTEDVRKSVIDPFYTTRTTRRVGLGIPLLKLAAEQTGGQLSIASWHESEFADKHGTVVTALFCKNHIDFTPLGDIVSTIVTLIQGHPEIDFSFTHHTLNGDVTLDTRELRSVLGDVPLNEIEVLHWISENLNEQYSSL